MRITSHEPVSDIPNIPFPPFQRIRGEYLRRALVVSEPGREVLWKIQLVELYEDGVIVRWVSTQDREAAQPSSDADTETGSWGLELTIRDDVGTSYESEGWGGTGYLRWRGEKAFRPGVPDHATMLEVRGAEYEIRLPLNPSTT